MILDYAKIYEQYNKYIPYQEWWDERYKAFLAEEFKRIYPKKKKIDIFKMTVEDCENARSIYKPIAEKLIYKYNRRKELLKGLLNQLRETEIEVELNPNLNRIYSVSTSTYSTQTACYTYTMGDAKVEAQFLNSLNIPGLIVEIRDNTKAEYGKFGRYDTGCIEVWANILPWQYDYLKYSKSPTMLEHCVSLWKVGINPKVKYPFINNELYVKSMAIHMGKKI